MRILDERSVRLTKLELRAAADGEKFPDGICGRLTGIALVYGVIDDYGTMFERGCLDKTRVEKVNAGKVKLLADHGPFTDMHVGTIRSMQDIGDAAVMSADIFDTEAGRRMHEYLKAVLASGSETGLSVGFRAKKKEWKTIEEGDARGDSYLCFQEIQLGEISVTPAPAVPGAEVTGVRRKKGETDEDLLERTLRAILGELPEQAVRQIVDEVYAKSEASTAKVDTPATPAPPAAEPAKADAQADGSAASATPADATETPEEVEKKEEETNQVSVDERMAFARAHFGE